MSLLRDIPHPVDMLGGERLLATCSELLSTEESTSPGVPLRDTTADVMISTGDIGDPDYDEQGAQISSGGIATANGIVIDRLLDVDERYEGVVVAPTITSTRGSTEADRKLAMGILVQHGDSSGGGDMAEFSTGFRPQDRVFFSSARTSAQANWDDEKSTGPFYSLRGIPGYYDLRGAKRYIRVQVRAGKNSVTTESSGDEQCRVGAVGAFFAADNLPEGLDTTSPHSSSTSTST